MGDRPRVIVTRRLPDAVEAELTARFDVLLSPTDAPTDAEMLQSALAEADGLLSTVTDKLTADIFAARPLRTKIIANFGVGYDNIDLAAARAHNIVVTNTPDVLTDCTADLAMMLVLMTMRRAGEGEREVRSERWSGWRPNHLMGRRVTGKTLGLVGMGRIARAVAQRAHFGFGMHVLGYNPRPLSADMWASIGAEPVESLDELLSSSDVVSLHCPSKPDTRGMMNAARLASMKAGSFLINTARGDIVNDDDLIAALRSGHLSGAGLDVFRNEPNLDPRYRLIENVVLLPHMGSATVETRDAMGMRAIDNLTAFFAGGAAPNRVA